MPEIFFFTIAEASAHLFTQELDTTSLLQQLNSGSGSARTDYQSNHMLIDRAKKKRKFLKGSLESSESGSTVDLTSFQGKILKTLYKRAEG